MGSAFECQVIDFLIWIVSFTATTAFNVMQGLLISIGFALATVIIRMQWPKWRRKQRSDAPAHIVGRLLFCGCMRERESCELRDWL